MQKNLIPIFLILLFTQCATASRNRGINTEKTTDKITTVATTPKKSAVEKKDTIAPKVNYRKITFGKIKAQGKIWGVDISHHQGNVDWEKLETQKPHFIFIKATEGATNQDSKYKENYKEAKKLNILVGSYHFFTYLSNGKNQAKNFLANVKHKNGDLPLVLDAEFAKKMPTKKLVQNELISFINTIYRGTKHYPIVYCDYDYYLEYLKNRIPERVKLWIVDYRGKPDCKWTFWQTTDKFRIEGIQGNVDFNLFNGTKKKLNNMLF